ncbi:MAG: tRNA 5-methoxyuridine(34)/uridine 5-oxyacetic acid(34) synthase CmoB [Deltaproteobacteria bacterium]|jgi:tRNA (mo5U34)-methyltransferase|nr:tRNA 5-methoxyuridine(34)/uridine 5-oxyacetic acid(34) synthase CmoB [Deltaproteobacteria bacterium]
MQYVNLLPNVDRKAILALLQEKERWLDLGKKGVERLRLPYERVKHIRAGYCDFSGDVVTIGQADELSEQDREKVYQVMRDFMPWRKGPFEVFGISIDAEWRSERKWNRVLPELPDLRGKIVADIGCNNGYYMFRMTQHEPELVLGFEPYLQHYYTFKTLNSFAGVENLAVELLGVEHIKLYRNCFDVVFLMGILYHRSSPVDVLRDIRSAMSPGGVLIVESQGIPGEEPQALFPAHRYAKVPGTYFVPTAPCLANWLSRAGFTDVKIFFSHPMSSREQRRTDWMAFESYEDFIDKSDSSLTVEGYPAPIRIFAKAVNPS